MKLTIRTATVLAAVACAALVGGHVSWAGAPPQTGQLSARALLTKMLRGNANERHALSLALKPSLADYKAIFLNVDDAKRAEDGYQRLWSQVVSRRLPDFGPRVPAQSELLLWSATTAELRAYTGNAVQFAGGWRKVALRLRPGLTFYRFKFVKPGETLGRAFGGLVRVNGRWVIIPKPWRVFR